MPKIIGLITVAAMYLAAAWSPCLAQQGRLPILKIDVSVGREQIDTFIERLSNFATDHGYRVRIGHPSPYKTLLQFQRDDLEVVAVNPYDIRTFLFGFYVGNDAAKADAGGTEFLGGIKAIVEMIPGATLTAVNWGLEILKLRVKPLYGWGSFDENTHSVTVPESFQVEATITEPGKPFQSALGFLKEPGHSLSGLWIALTQRVTPSNGS